MLLKVILYLAFSHFAYNVKLFVTFVSKLYFIFKALSTYHPAKIYPSLIGDVGSINLTPEIDWISATLFPPLDSKLIL